MVRKTTVRKTTKAPTKAVKNRTVKLKVAKPREWLEALKVRSDIDRDYNNALAEKLKALEDRYQTWVNFNDKRTLDMNKRLQGVEAQGGKLDEAVELLAMGGKALDVRVNRLDASVGAAHSKVNAVEERGIAHGEKLHDVARDVEDHRWRLNAVEAQGEKLYPAFNNHVLHVAESNKNLGNTIREILERLDALETRLSVPNEQIVPTSITMAVVEKRIGQIVNARLKEIEDRAKVLDALHDDLVSRVANRNQITLDRLTALDERVTVTNSFITDILERLNKFEEVPAHILERLKKTEDDLVATRHNLLDRIALANSYVEPAKPVRTKHVGWVNVYNGVSTSGVYTTEQEARGECAKGGVTARVEWEE